MSLTYEAHPLGPPNNYIIAHGVWSRGQQLMKRSHHGNNQQIMLHPMSLGSYILSSVHLQAESGPALPLLQLLV